MMKLVLNPFFIVLLKKKEDDYRRETARDRTSKENPLGNRSTKNRDNTQINRNLGKRGTKESEEKRKELHKGKKYSGKKNNNNFPNKDLVTEPRLRTRSG